MTLKKVDKAFFIIKSEKKNEISLKVGIADMF